MNKKVIIFSILILLIIIGGKYFSQDKSVQSDKINSPTVQDKPQIVSTKPDPLDNAIVSATESIEITFNRSIENVGEFKVRIDPKTDYKVELLSERKTAKIIFSKPLELGSNYTLSIGPDTKFDGVGAWGQEKSFQFRTIKYRGI